jgi:hypothetical protein
MLPNYNMFNGMPSADVHGGSIRLAEPEAPGSVEAHRGTGTNSGHCKLRNTREIYDMRKLIVAATALAFLSSTAAFAQGTAPSTTAPAAQSGNAMSKGASSSSKMTKMKKSKKSSKAKSENAK